MMERDSAELLRVSHNGDGGATEAAMGELLVRHLPTLRAFVRLQLPSDLRRRESESDLVQSVCRQVLQGADNFEFRGETRFRNWLYGAVLNKVRDRRDYHAAGKRDAAREQLRAWTPDEQHLLSKSYGSLFTASRQAMAQEARDQLERACERLSEPQRRVLCLSRITGLSHAEIAEELGVTEANSRQLLRRALARLAVLLTRNEERG